MNRILNQLHPGTRRLLQQVMASDGMTSNCAKCEIAAKHAIQAILMSGGGVTPDVIRTQLDVRRYKIAVANYHAAMTLQKEGDQADAMLAKLVANVKAYSAIYGIDYPI